MTTIKVKFRPSSVADHEGSLFYRVIHGRAVRQVNTGYKLYPWEWDAVNSEIVFPSDTREIRWMYLNSLNASLQADIKRIKGVVSRLDCANEEYTVEDVIKRYISSSGVVGILSFARGLIRQLEQIGKFRTAERYTTVTNSFERFLEGGDVPSNEVDSLLIMKFEARLKAAGVCPNTTSFYMRNLRAIYNRAVEMGLTMQCYPFRHVYTGIDKTVKRAVPLEVIRQIRNLDLTLHPITEFARDIFMFSFYTRGMSFIDMAYLKKKDLQNGILSYRRHKTGQQLFVKWEKPMREIVEKYNTEGSPYLLPIIKDLRADEWKQYRNVSHLVNNRLKKLGEKLSLSIPLTSYVARHAWASIARSRNVPLSVISEALGHDSEKTTRIYLASLDTSAVDRANSRILKAL